MMSDITVLGLGREWTPVGVQTLPRTGRLFVAMGFVATALVACAPDPDVDVVAIVELDDPAVAAFERAVALENGVVPVVVDFDLFDHIAPIEVTRNPDPVVRDVLRLVAAEDDPDMPFLGFDIQPDGDGRGLRHDVELGDGRTVELGRAALPDVSLAGADGQFVNVGAPRLQLDELLDVVAGSEIVDDEITELPDGWIEIASLPEPVWIDGFSLWVALPGKDRSYWISVARNPGAWEQLARYGPTEPVELGTGGWAYRYYPRGDSERGFVFQYDSDRVVTIKSYDLTEEQLRQLVDTVRDAEPGELEIHEPRS